MTRKNQDPGAPADAAAPTLPAAPVESAGDVSSASETRSSGPVPSEPVSLTPEQLQEAIERGVSKWASVHFRNSPVSRATPALNYLRQHAVPDLANVILKEIF